jgi:hypothetical protein
LCGMRAQRCMCCHQVCVSKYSVGAPRGILRRVVFIRHNDLLMNFQGGLWRLHTTRNRLVRHQHRLTSHVKGNCKLRIVYLWAREGISPMQNHTLDSQKPLQALLSRKTSKTTCVISSARLGTPRGSKGHFDGF